MINNKKLNRQILRSIESHNFSTKIKLYFSTKTVGDYFDPYEANYNYTNLNPITIKGYVSDFSFEALIWKQYGLSEVGAKEIICNEKYAEWFRLCAKIEIDGDTYQTYKENVGNRHLITKLPAKLVKIVVTKMK